MGVTQAKISRTRAATSVVLNAGQTVKQQVTSRNLQPLGTVRLTAADMQDPARIARAISDAQLSTAQSVAVQRSNPITGAGGVHVRNIPVVAATAKVITHNLGRPYVGYLVTRTQSTTAATFQTSIFASSGTFTPLFSGTHYFDGAGGGGAGGSGATGIVGSAQAQSGGGGGAGAITVHSTGTLVQGFSVTVTIAAAAAGVAGAAGANGGDSTFGSAFAAPGAAGGEFGGTPTAGNAAGGGSNNQYVGIARVPGQNPTFFDSFYGGWGGSTLGPVGQGGTQGRGAQGFAANISNFGSSIGLGGSGGVQGAVGGGNAGGGGGGGGGAGGGIPGTAGSHAGANGRPGGAGSAAGTGSNGTNGLSAAATTGGAGGGGGGAGGNGAVAGGTGGTGGSGATGWIAVSWVGVGLVVSDIPLPAGVSPSVAINIFPTTNGTIDLWIF